MIYDSGWLMISEFLRFQKENLGLRKAIDHIEEVANEWGKINKMKVQVLQVFGSDSIPKSFRKKDLGKSLCIVNRLGATPDLESKIKTYRDNNLNISSTVIRYLSSFGYPLVGYLSAEAEAYISSNKFWYYKRDRLLPLKYIHNTEIELGGNLLTHVRVVMLGITPVTLKIYKTTKKGDRRFFDNEVQVYEDILKIEPYPSHVAHYLGSGMTKDESLGYLFVELGTSLTSIFPKTKITRKPFAKDISDFEPILKDLVPTLIDFEQPKYKVNDNFRRVICKQLIETIQQTLSYGILNRDIKIDNFILVNRLVKMIDFGISHTTTTKNITIRGSLTHYSPKSIHNPNFYTCESEKYSLGLALYEIITDSEIFPEFIGNSKAIIDHRLDDGFIEIDKSLMERYPKVVEYIQKFVYDSYVEVDL
jgi:serine/threonine protein kinase